MQTTEATIRSRREFLLRSCVAAALVSGSCLAFPLARAQQIADNSRFIGNLNLHVSERDGKALYTLLDDFGYVDPNGKRWQAKLGLETDGATIPPVFWPIVGHPFEGLYVKAAVIHDYYCLEQHRYREWEKVHHVFHEGMITNGVNSIKAALMFYAVWRFGPRWRVEEIKPCTPTAGEFCVSAEPTAYQVTSETVASFSHDDERAQLQRIKAALDSQKITVADIPEIEAKLPSLQRLQTFRDVPARSGDGWWLRHPYDFPLEAPQT
jgi:hypothetical protein